MKNIKKIKFLMFSLMVAFLGCQENSDYEFGQIITPSNISITAEIIGADEANPNGDGSGVVKFTATADNAVSYKFVYNNTETVSTSGVYEHSFSKLGLNTYTVSVLASGTAGVSSSKSIQVDVLSTYSPPQDLLDKLYGDGSKVWRIQSAKPGHFGLGPVGGTTPTEWYGAAAEEKAGLGMYNDRYTFNIDGTFTHATAGDIFGRNPYIFDDLGAQDATRDGDDVLNYVYADYTETMTLTAPGGVETLTFSGNGFIGYYTGGNHSYEIFDRSVPNELLIKTTDGNSVFDWWFIIVSD